MPNLKTFRPGGARVVAYAAAASMIVMSVVIGVALPPEITFTVAQLITLALILLAVLALLHGVGRSFVRADDDGVEVLNGYWRRRVPWAEIEGFAMNRGAPWPTLVTTSDERIMLFGIQGSDGAYARDAVAYLRGRLP